MGCRETERAPPLFQRSPQARRRGGLLFVTIAGQSVASLAEARRPPDCLIQTAPRTGIPSGCNTLDDLPAPWNNGIGRQKAAAEKNWLLFLIAGAGKAKPAKIPVPLVPKLNGSTAKAPIGIPVDQGR